MYVYTNQLACVTVLQVLEERPLPIQVPDLRRLPPNQDLPRRSLLWIP